MNYIALATLLIFVIFMGIGFKRGFFKQATSLLLCVVPMILSYFISPLVGAAIVNNTNIEDKIYDGVYNKIETTVEENIKKTITEKKEEVAVNIDDNYIKNATEEYMNTEFNRSQQVDIINNLPIPSFMKNGLLENNNDEIKDSLGITGFYQYVSRYITYMAMNLIAFIATYILIMIVMTVIKIAIAFAVELPIVRSIDKLGGLVFGFAQALAIVWVLLLATVMLSGTQAGDYIISQIDDNMLLSFLYQKNLLVHVITNFTHII